MLKKYFYKTALTTAALSTAVSVLLAGCGQSAGTGTAKTNTVTSAVSGQTDIRSSSNSDSGSTADSAGTSGADSSSATTSYTITDEEIAAAYANTDNSYDAMYLPPAGQSCRYLRNRALLFYDGRHNQTGVCNAPD